MQALSDTENGLHHLQVPSQKPIGAGRSAARVKPLSSSTSSRSLKSNPLRDLFEYSRKSRSSASLKASPVSGTWNGRPNANMSWKARLRAPDIRSRYWLSDGFALSRDASPLRLAERRRADPVKSLRNPLLVRNDVLGVPALRTSGRWWPGMATFTRSRMSQRAFPRGEAAGTLLRETGARSPVAQAGSTTPARASGTTRR
jgi:hypothetical protein